MPYIVFSYIFKRFSDSFRINVETNGLYSITLRRSHHYPAIAAAKVIYYIPFFYLRHFKHLVHYVLRSWNIYNIWFTWYFFDFLLGGWIPDFLASYLLASSGTGQLTAQLSAVQFTRETDFHFSVAEFQFYLKCDFIIVKIDLLNGYRPVHCAQVWIDPKQLFPAAVLRCDFKLPLADNSAANACPFYRNITPLRPDYPGQLVSLDCSFKTRFPLLVLDFALTLKRQFSFFECNVRNLMFTPLALPFRGWFSWFIRFDHEHSCDITLAHLEFHFPIAHYHRHSSEAFAFNFELTSIIW